MKKYLVSFEHTRTYQVFVSAISKDDARSKAIKTVWENGLPKNKYMVDDEATAKSVKCLVS